MNEPKLVQRFRAFVVCEYHRLDVVSTIFHVRPGAMRIKLIELIFSLMDVCVGCGWYDSFVDLLSYPNDNIQICRLLRQRTSNRKFSWY
jgi:hypothetical protein